MTSRQRQYTFLFLSIGAVLLLASVVSHLYAHYLAARVFLPDGGL